MQLSEEMLVAFLTTAVNLTVSWRNGKFIICRCLAYGFLNLMCLYFGDLVAYCQFVL